MDFLVKDTKAMISGVLVSSKFKLTLRELNRDFREQVGHDIPYQKLGYDSLEMYLRSLNDAVQVIGQGENARVVPVSKMSAHVVDMVSRQRYPKGKNIRPNYRSGPSYQLYPQCNNEMSFFRTSPSYNNTGSSMTLSNYQQQTNRRQQSNPYHDAYSTPTYNSRTFVNSAQVDGKHNWNSDSSYHTTTYSDKFNKDEVENRTTYKPTAQNATTYFNIHKSNKSLKSPKFPSNDDLNASLQGACDTPSYDPSMSPKQGSVIRSCSNFETSSRISSSRHSLSPADISDDEVFYSDDEEINTRVPQIVQNNLRTLVKKYPDGIWCAKVPDLYKKEFGTHLQYVEYGYISLVQMCLDLGNSFHCIQPDRSDYKLFDKSLHITNDNLRCLKISEYLQIKANVQESTKPALPAGVEELLMHIHQDNIPSGIVKIGTYVEKQWLDSSEIVDSFLDVNVAEIYDPSKFWFNLKRQAAQLNNLMDNMQTFYAANALKYTVPKLGLKLGLYIAVIFLQEYHRAVIVDTEILYSKNLLKAFFIDYGSVSLVSSEGVCYLHEQFVALPAQAIRGRLKGIYPPHRHQQWSRDASSLFLSLVKNKDLVAQITRIDTEKEMLELLLADTSDEEDFFINDALAFRGEHAFFMSEKQLEPLKSEYVPIVRHIHLFPTFDELETGKVPNATQMIHFENAGFGIERIYPGYFKNMDKESPKSSESLKSFDSPKSEGTSRSWKFDYDLAERMYEEASSPILNTTRTEKADGSIKPVLVEKKHDWTKLLSEEDIAAASFKCKSRPKTQIKSERASRNISADLPKTSSILSAETEQLASNINLRVPDNPMTTPPKVSPIPKNEVRNEETNKLPEPQLLNPEKPPFIPLSQSSPEIKRNVPPPPGFKNVRPVPLHDDQQGNCMQQVLNINQVHQLQLVLQNAQPKYPARDLSLIYQYYPNISPQLAVLFLQTSYHMQNLMSDPVYSYPTSGSHPNFYGSHPAYPHPSYCVPQPPCYTGPPQYNVPPSFPSASDGPANNSQPPQESVSNQGVNTNFNGDQNIAGKLELGNVTQSATDVSNNELVCHPSSVGMKNTELEPVAAKSFKNEDQNETQVSEQESRKTIAGESSEEMKVKENETCEEKKETRTSSIDADHLKREIISEILEAIKNGTSPKTEAATVDEDATEKCVVEEKMHIKENIINQGAGKTPKDTKRNGQSFLHFEGDCLHKKDEKPEITCIENCMKESGKQNSIEEGQDILKCVAKHVLGSVTVHVITHNNRSYFSLQEMASILLGKPVSVVQLRKMFIGKEHSVSFFDVSLKKYPHLKKELLKFNLVEKTTLTINVIAVSDVAQFVKILTNDSTVNNFDKFLNDVKKLSPVIASEY